MWYTFWITMRDVWTIIGLISGIIGIITGVILGVAPFDDVRLSRWRHVVGFTIFTVSVCLTIFTGSVLHTYML